MRDLGLLYVNAMRVRCLDCICVCCKWCFTMWALGQHQNHNLLFTHCLTFCIYREPKRKKKQKKKPTCWSCFYQSCFSHHPFKAQVLERDRSLCLSDSASSSLSHPPTSSWGFHSLFTATFLLIKSSDFPPLDFPPPWLCFKGICVCSPTFRIWFLLGFSELSLSCFPS